MIALAEFAGGHSVRFAQGYIDCTSRTKLRCADSYAGTITQFIAAVKHIEQGQFDVQLADAGQGEIPVSGKVDLSVGGQFAAVGESIAQTAAINHVGTQVGIVPGTGNTCRSGNALISIHVNPVVGDVVQFILIEIELSGDHITRL